MASGQVSFQVRKYSWSTDSDSNGKAKYQHLTGSNIYLVLRGEERDHGEMTLRIVQATAVLDKIDLAKHIDIARSTRETFRRVQREVADKQLPTYAVTSGAKLAITHRPEDGKTHRMQVAMFHDDDCTKLVDILRYRGMVFVEASGQRSRASTTDTALRSVVSEIPVFTRGRPPSFAPSTTNKIWSGTAVEPLKSYSRKQASGSGPSFLSVEARKSEQIRSQPSAHGLFSDTDVSSHGMAARKSHQTQSQPPTRNLFSDPFLVRDEHVAPRNLVLASPTASQGFSFSSMQARTGSDNARALFDPAIGASSRSFSKPASTTHTPFDTAQFPTPETFRSTTRSWLNKTASLGSDMPLVPDHFETVPKPRSRSSSVLSLTALPKPRLKLDHQTQQDTQPPDLVTRSTTHIALSSSDGLSSSTPLLDKRLGDRVMQNNVTSTVLDPMQQAQSENMNKTTRAQTPSLVAKLKISRAAHSQATAAPHSRPVAAMPATKNIQGGRARTETPSRAITPSQIVTRSQAKRHNLGVAQDTEANTKRELEPDASQMPPPTKSRRITKSQVTRSSPKTMNELLHGSSQNPSDASEGRTTISQMVKPSAQLDVTPSEAVDSQSVLVEAALPAMSNASAVERIIQSTTLPTLQQYTSLEESDRKKVLEKFMSDMLGNSDFAILCQDMSACWQSLALGS